MFQSFVLILLLLCLFSCNKGSIELSAKPLSVNANVPSLKFTSPASGSLLLTSSLSSVALSGLCSVEGKSVNFSGSITGTVLCTSGTFVITVDLTTAADGNLSIVATQINGEGVSGSSTLSLLKDTADPVLSFSSPLPGSKITSSSVSSLSVGGTCSEEGSNVSISGDAAGNVTCSSSSWSMALDFSGASEGAVSITATQVDAAGNVGSSSINFTKDTVGPNPPSLSSLTPLSPSSSTTSTLVGSASSDTTQVVLSTSSDCSTTLTTLSKSAFESSGFGITVASNSKVSIFARAYDSDNNFSACTYLTKYQHSSGTLLLENLAAFWELEEASGPRLDSHNMNDLSAPAGATSSAGKVSSALDFDGTSNQVLTLSNASAGDLQMGTEDFSVAFWIYYTGTTNSANYTTIASFGATNTTSPGYTVAMRNTPRVYLWYSNGTSRLTTCYVNAIPTGTWAHVVISIERSPISASFTAYLNGSYQYKWELGHTSTEDIQSVLDFEFGKGIPNFTTGKVDQFGIWKRALNASEVSWLYNSNNGRAYADLSGYTN